jgi:hypothetical protein
MTEHKYEEAPGGEGKGMDDYPDRRCTGINILGTA